MLHREYGPNNPYGRNNELSLREDTIWDNLKPYDSQRIQKPV